MQLGSSYDIYDSNSNGKINSGSKFVCLYGEMIEQKTAAEHERRIKTWTVNRKRKNATLFTTSLDNSLHIPQENSRFNYKKQEEKTIISKPQIKIKTLRNRFDSTRYIPATFAEIVFLTNSVMIL